MKSVDRRALKLLAVKFGGLKKKSAASAFTAKECATAFGLDSSVPVVEYISFSKLDGQ